MKKYWALSVVKPAGQKIGSGLKTVEVRRWRPPFLPLRDLVIVENSRRLSPDFPEESDGVVVALVDVVSVEDWKRDDYEAAAASYWEPGWLGWKLDNVRRVAPGVAAPARLGIYELELLALF